MINRTNLDDLLRSAEFVIVSRPTNGEAQWRRPMGEVMGEAEAVAWAKLTKEERFEKVVNTVAQKLRDERNKAKGVQP